MLNADDDGLTEGPIAHAVSIETSEFAHEIHETLFNVLLALIALHVAAVIYYHWRGKDLVRPMITGKGAVARGRGADAAGQMVGRVAVPARRARLHPLGRRRRAAVRDLCLARAGAGTTSRPC